MIGADAIVKCLEEEGVTYVFGYPGVAICPFYNSILDSSIHTILIRTEQNAAHAASGFSRVSGKIGVCAVTSGPGATNVITLQRPLRTASRWYALPDRSIQSF